MNRPASPPAIPPAALPDFPFATPERPALVRGAFFVQNMLLQRFVQDESRRCYPRRGADEVEAARLHKPAGLWKPAFTEVRAGRTLSPHPSPIGDSFPPGGSQPYRTPSPDRGRCPRRGRMRSKLPACTKPAGLWKPAFTEVCAGRPKKTAKYTLPRTLHAIMTLSNFTTQGGFL